MISGLDHAVELNTHSLSLQLVQSDQSLLQGFTLVDNFHLGWGRKSLKKLESKTIVIVLWLLSRRPGLTSTLGHRFRDNGGEVVISVVNKDPQYLSILLILMKITLCAGESVRMQAFIACFQGPLPSLYFVS